MNTILVDQYEICFDPERPDTLRIIDTEAQSFTEYTLLEAVNLLSVMLKHKEDLRLIRTGY